MLTRGKLNSTRVFTFVRDSFCSHHMAGMGYHKETLRCQAMLSKSLENIRISESAITYGFATLREELLLTPVHDMFSHHLWNLSDGT